MTTNDTTPSGEPDLVAVVSDLFAQLEVAAEAIKAAGEAVDDERKAREAGNQELKRNFRAKIIGIAVVILLVVGVAGYFIKKNHDDGTTQAQTQTQAVLDQCKRGNEGRTIINQGVDAMESIREAALEIQHELNGLTDPIAAQETPTDPAKAAALENYRKIIADTRASVEASLAVANQKTANARLPLIDCSKLGDQP